MKFLFNILCLLFLSTPAFSQLYFKGALKANQEKLYRNLVQRSINKNLSLPLNDSTEENWQEAFNALEVTRYQSMWVDGRIDSAAEWMHTRSITFQRSALELLYARYPEKYYRPVKFLLLGTTDAKTFALCAEYILQSSHAREDLSFLSVKTKQFSDSLPGNPIPEQLAYRLSHWGKPEVSPSLQPFFQKDYLPGKVLVLSLQRKDRNYPGIVIVRDRYGNFIRDSLGNLFSVPQLALSNNGLPGYLSNGNTPEGIFRMKGYDVSRSTFIGPTVNIQLTMPYERSPKHFYADSSISDTSWNIRRYRNLLPDGFKDHYPLYQSYYAGMAGRTEIIIHGTTLNPDYYIRQPYYPMTPTQGCLTSKEIWDGETGRRSESDQQLLINAMIKAGGADGYAIVINIGDEKQAVTVDEILKYLR
ncbi:hypothetical protein [Ferruginibacter sp. HRS2-29]|uniref:hypothetical protein n=1 Tax=Ferruginibacter sp. HRS2-29 TaxID=2487334 RepID=UPI0020CB88B6|nr:hypothetical protein [Ferruginibacter sp. HRS2-29]MCP9751845.1 hypothetical protein [Ferruginibacter sp. HRS2-29]